MDALIFTGIQASGKTTFYLQHFFRTHLHISLDVLRTRRREQAILAACLGVGQRFVLDNTNVSATERAGYIQQAKDHHFRVLSYYFEMTLREALRRNAGRAGKENIPETGIRAKAKHLQPPTFDEGFDALFVVHIGEQGSFVVREVPREL